MRNLVIGNLPQSRRSLNLGEYAEDATLVMEEQPTKEKRPLFIEANTMEATLDHLKSDCIIPVFAKDNEATLSHVAFIEYPKQFISLPINYWKVIRLSITKGVLL